MAQKLEEFDIEEFFLRASESEPLRVIGAITGGFGAYMMTRVIQKHLGAIWRGVPIAPLEPLRGAWAAFQAWAFPFLGDPRLTLDPMTARPAVEEVLFAPDPFAISIGIVTTGYLAAGQNPAEILKGIGELIPL